MDHYVVIRVTENDDTRRVGAAYIGQEIQRYAHRKGYEIVVETFSPPGWRNGQAAPPWGLLNLWKSLDDWFMARSVLKKRYGIGGTVTRSTWKEEQDAQT